MDIDNNSWENTHHEYNQFVLATFKFLITKIKFRGKK